MSAGKGLRGEDLANQSVRQCCAVVRPGCGSLSVEPGIAERLAIKSGEVKFSSRTITLGSLEDDIEFCFEKSWTDGLPVVPPTEERVYRMLKGTGRKADECWE